MGKGPSIIVVGAGIVGSSIAWHLAREGARVTILDAGSPGGVATPNSFAWINSNHSFAEAYFRLRHHSMTEWRTLAEKLPQLPVSFPGSIYLPAKGLDLNEFVVRNAAWGYRIELVDGARVKALEPRWREVPEFAAHALDEGAAEAHEVAALLTAAAAGEGALLRPGTRVDGLVFDDARVAGVHAGGEALKADEVLIAAGTATPELVAGTGFRLPLDMPPGLLAHTRPLPRLLNGLVLAQGLHVRQKPNGQILAGADFQGSVLSDDPDAGGRELVRRLRDVLDTDEAIELERTTVGTRPMPLDGVPVIGRLPDVAGLYVAVMHSGVTLCPSVGAFAARELVSGERDGLLDPFGPERFTEAPFASARASALR